MGNRRTLFTLVAAVVALAAGAGVYAYVTGADARARARVDAVDAYVATADIPKGTSGSAALAQGLIAPASVLRDSVPPAAVTDLESLRTKVASATISARQFITGSSFVAPSQAGGGSLATTIASRDLVAVTVAFDPARALAGQVAPGDRVDLISVGEAGSHYLLRDVKVLAVGTETAASAAGGNGQPSTTAAASGLITFEVTSDQALQIVAESRSGTLHMTLQALGAAAGDTRSASVPAKAGQ